MMIWEEIKAIQSSRKDIRNFAFTVGGVLLAIGVLRGHHHKPGAAVWMALGGLLITAGLAAPEALRPLQKAWMSLAVVMGWVSSRVVLTALYYGVLSPLSLACRLSGKKFLDLKIDRSQKTYWNLRAAEPLDKSAYEKQH